MIQNLLAPRERSLGICALLVFSSYQKQLAVLGSRRRCAGARLASPQTGGHTLQSGEEPSPAPSRHTHTVPWFKPEHTHTHTQQRHLRVRGKVGQLKNTGHNSAVNNMVRIGLYHQEIFTLVFFVFFFLEKQLLFYCNVNICYLLRPEIILLKNRQYLR